MSVHHIKTRQCGLVFLLKSSAEQFETEQTNMSRQSFWKVFLGRLLLGQTVLLEWSL